MFEVFRSVLSFLRAWFHSNASLQLDIVAPRHRLAVTRRRHPKPRLTAAERYFWVWHSRTWAGWRSALMIVKPDTVIAWRRGLPAVPRYACDEVTASAFSSDQPPV